MCVTTLLHKFENLLTMLWEMSCLSVLTDFSDLSPTKPRLETLPRQTLVQQSLSVEFNSLRAPCADKQTKLFS